MHDSDADYAAAVLEGRAHTRGAWSSYSQQGRSGSSGQAGGRASGRGQQGAAGRGRSGAADGGAGGSGGGGGGRGKKPRREARQQQQWPQQQQRPQQQQQSQQPVGTGNAGPGTAAGSASEGLAAAAHSQPGPRSTARVAHCTACDVWVPRRPGDWEVHTAGIRHRRQLLSLRVHGERNRLVLSAFESEPGAGAGALWADGRSGCPAARLAPAPAAFWGCPHRCFVQPPGGVKPNSRGVYIISADFPPHTCLPAPQTQQRQLRGWWARQPETLGLRLATMVAAAGGRGNQRSASSPSCCRRRASFEQRL